MNAEDGFGVEDYVEKAQAFDGETEVKLDGDASALTPDEADALETARLESNWTRVGYVSDDEIKTIEAGEGIAFNDLDDSYIVRIKRIHVSLDFQQITEGRVYFSKEDNGLYMSHQVWNSLGAPTKISVAVVPR